MPTMTIQSGNSRQRTLEITLVSAGIWTLSLTAATLQLPAPKYHVWFNKCCSSERACIGTSQELSHSPSEMTKCHWKLFQCTPDSPRHRGGRSQVPSHPAEQRLDAQTPSQGWHQGRHQAQGSRALCLQLHPRGGRNV